CARLAADEGLECGELTANDNCGAERTVDCGTTACASGQCNPNNTCAPVVICTTETDDAFCARLAADEGLECGEITADDNCGTERTVDCGTTACASGQCNLDNTCVPVVVCTPETDDAFCTRLAADEGLECGELTANDNCGAERTVDCGTTACASGQCNLDNTCVPVVVCETWEIECGTNCCDSATEVCDANEICQTVGPTLIPTLTGFNPLEAAFDATLRIRGTNFSTTPSENSVTLGGFQVPAANILSATETEIALRVPKNTLCTGPLQICTGPVEVRVNGQAAVSSTPYVFTYATTATVTTLAGGSSTSSSHYSDATGAAARFYYPRGIVVEPTTGNLYVSDYSNYRIRMVTPSGVVSTIAGNGSSNYLDHVTGTSAQFTYPRSIAIDSWGDLYVADSNSIRRIDSGTSRAVTTLAGSSTSGFLDGTGTTARFNGPYGIAIDEDDNLYVADRGNHRIRKVSRDGIVTTVAGSGTAGAANGTGTAAQFRLPEGIAIDLEGNLYVADNGNDRIRKVAPNGAVTDFANISGPAGIVADTTTGNLYVTSNTHRIYRVSPSGVVTTVAGSNTSVYGYVDGIGIYAYFNVPQGITINAQGILYVVDNYNHRIRRIVIE
ncbi:MAG: IPT/TIG domain-containing protein, partial [Cystobacterineae bacterium]|nr:IPT/TIG domain-containing protein [Cystobacterineae bacterium]